MKREAVDTSDRAAPAVSIVIPVYNAEPYLAESIKSVLAQTWTDFELIIIDDCSKDRSPEIVQSFHDARIRYYRNERNAGVAASRNRGIQLARGELVAQMDQDDIARPYRIAVQVAFLGKHPDIGLCGGAIVKFSPTSRHRITFPVDHEELRVTHLFHSGFAHPTVMARRAFLVANGLYYDETCRNQEDYELWCRLVEKTRVANLKKVLLEYRSHATQLSRESSEYFTMLLKRLHRRVLAQLQIEPTEEEFKLHHQISLFGDTTTMSSLSEASDWLNKLLAANRRVRFYRQRAMDRVFGKKWAWLCRQAAGEGLPVFLLYWGDPLSKPVRYSVDTLKLLAKCLLKR